MIRAIAKALELRLRARGWRTIRVFDGEDTDTASYGRERIVLDPRAGGGDTFGPPKKSTGNNPKQRYTVMVPVTITLFAQSTAKGAQEYEHRRRVESMRDAVLCALDYVAGTNAIVSWWRPVSGALVTPLTLEGSARPGGAVYELQAEFLRGVYDVDYDGSAAPETALGGEDGVSISHTTSVRLPGGTPTTCGHGEEDGDGGEDADGGEEPEGEE